MSGSREATQFLQVPVDKKTFSQKVFTGISCGHLTYPLIRFRPAWRRIRVPKYGPFVYRPLLPYI
jgi:hypothetical protein